MYFGFKIIYLVHFMGVLISSSREFNIKEAPFVVTLKLQSGYYFTGSLSAMNKVMTSAVVFLEIETDTAASPDLYVNTTVYAGVLEPENNASDLFQNRTVIDVQISPNYVHKKGGTSQSDVSLAFLNRPFYSSDTITIFPIEEPKTFQDTWDNMGKDDCFVVGAGSLNNKEGKSLRKISVILLTDCFNMTIDALKLYYFGCAQPANTANDKFCAGDDGGPVICQGKVFGIISSQPECVAKAILFHVLGNDLSFISSSSTCSVKIILLISSTLISILKLKK